MRFTIDTATDSYEQALATLNAAYGRVVSDHGRSKVLIDVLDLGLSNEPAADGWSSALLFRLVTDLAPGAREALRYVSEHTPTVSFDEVAEHLGQPVVDGRSTGQLGGTMTSLRAALRRIPGNLPPPLARDNAARRYVMDEKIAALLRDAFAVADRQPQLLRE